MDLSGSCTSKLTLHQQAAKQNQNNLSNEKLMHISGNINRRLYTQQTNFLELKTEKENFPFSSFHKRAKDKKYCVPSGKEGLISNSSIKQLKEIKGMKEKL